MHTKPYDPAGNAARIEQLRTRGVDVWGPERVYIGDDVPLHRIEPGAVIFAARITGASSWIGSGARIGTSGLAVIHDSQIGSHADVGAGTYENATLLARVKTRGFAELRTGTLLEEEAETGHNVGLKNTVFTAAVVAGSNINFCDVLMTGGTSRRDHSEVGSGAVHFNFDPRGDKFGSLLGDIRGVLLRSPRIFVGGNVGLVAPIHLDFGVVVAAGSTVRRDVAENQLVGGGSQQAGPVLYDSTVYRELSGKLFSTAKLVSNLHALSLWYSSVRIPYADSSERPPLEGARVRLAEHLRHRVHEFGKVLEKVEAKGQHFAITRVRTEICDLLLSDADGTDVPQGFLKHYEVARKDKTHVDGVRSLGQDAVASASSWLAQKVESRLQRLRTLLGILE